MKYIIIPIVLILILIGGYVAIMKTNTTTTSPQKQIDTNSAKSYTLADIASHNSKSSCWTSINGNVYDLTQWIDNHPGGAENILGICGIDGTSAFTNQHGGQQKPENQLSTFLIGTLKS
jgi:cytochrome b involved in lipid metabolism